MIILKIYLLGCLFNLGMYCGAWLSDSAGWEMKRWQLSLILLIGCLLSWIVPFSLIKCKIEELTWKL